jgi:hypothetical protein
MSALTSHFRKKAAETDSSITNGALATAGLLALGLVGRKGAKDVGHVGDLARKWMLSSQTAAKRVEGSGLADAVRATKTYTANGRELATSKILGVHLPYGLMQASTAIDSVLQAGKPALSTVGDYLKRGPLRGLSEARWGAITGGKDGLVKRLLTPRTDAGWGSAWADAHAPIPNHSRHAHYSKYKNAPMDDLNHYAMYGDVWPKLNETTRSMLQGPSAGSLSAALLRLRKTDPEQAQILTNHLKEQVTLFGGKGALGGGLAHKYYHDGLPQLRRVGDMFSLAGDTALAGTAAGAAYTGAEAWKRHQREKSAAVESDDNLAGAALAGAGVGLGASGVSTLRSPLDVGVTWSEVADHGDGHKNPGKAIAEAIAKLKAEDPRFANINIDHVIRNSHGAVDPKFFGKTHDAFFDTGMGATSRHGYDVYNPTANIEHRVPGARLSDPVRPKVRLGGFAGYTTDIGALGNPHDSYKTNVDSLGRWIARKLGVKDNYIAWGPKDLLESQSPGEYGEAKKLYNMHHVSHSGMPTLTAAANDAVSWAHDVGREGVFAEALKSNALTPEQKSMLRNIGDRKLLFVTGSGRGDYVATRMLDIQRSLRRQGLEHKYLLAGVLGSTAGINPDAARLIKDPSVLTFGRLPPNLYIGLPAVADLHSASTGTSAAMEALSGPANLAFVPEWTKLRERELRRLVGGAGKFRGIVRDEGVRAAIKGILPHVNLDVWNPGNRAYGMRQPGVHAAQSGDDFVRIAEGLTEADAAAARSRGLRQMGHNSFARGRMTESIASILGRQQNWKRVRGGGKLALGAGLTGLGLASLGGGGSRVAPANPAPAAAPVAAAAPSKLDGLLKSLPSWAQGDSCRNLAIGGGAAAVGSLLAYLMARRRKRRDQETPT